MFVPNRFLDLLPGRPEVTGPLSAKIGSVEEGLRHATPSGCTVRHFVIFDGENPFHNWAPQAAQQEIVCTKTTCLQNKIAVTLRSYF